MDKAQSIPMFFFLLGKHFFLPSFSKYTRCFVNMHGFYSVCGSISNAFNLLKEVESNSKKT